MPLFNYLLRAGAISGPLSKNTSHSSLEVIKKYLIGAQQFRGDEKFLRVGHTLHELFLTGSKTGFNNANEQDQELLISMLRSLSENDFVNKLMKGAICEEKFYVRMNSVEVAVILDGKQPHLKRGFDLKTTRCASESSFIAKTHEYGYVRQALTYRLCAGLTKFYFIGVQKDPPYQVYVYDYCDHADENKYAEEELKFLLYFYKYYGNVLKNIGEVSGHQQETDNLITYNVMATGKEAMATIKNSLKEYKAAAKNAEKMKKAAQKAIDKFPKKELELYQEQIDAAQDALSEAKYVTN